MKFSIHMHNKLLEILCPMMNLSIVHDPASNSVQSLFYLAAVHFRGELHSNWSLVPFWV